MKNYSDHWKKKKKKKKKKKTFFVVSLRYQTDGFTDPVAKIEIFVGWILSYLWSEQCDRWLIWESKNRFGYFLTSVTKVFFAFWIIKRCCPSDKIAKTRHASFSALSSPKLRTKTRGTDTTFRSQGVVVWF